MGRASIGGFDVDLDRRRVHPLVGFMPDSFILYDDLDVSQYLEYFARAHRIPRKQRSRTIREVIELTDLQVKTHIAKQGWEMPGFLGWLRDQFRLLPRGASNHFDMFERVRAAIDPTGVFLSPMLEQWLTTNNPTLTLDPAKFPLDATGYVELPDGTSLTWANHFPHKKTFP